MASDILSAAELAEIEARVTRDEAADDIAQESFVKLWQNCAEVRHPKSFIYTVARNAAASPTPPNLQNSIRAAIPN